MRDNRQRAEACTVGCPRTMLSGKAWTEEITRTVASSGLPWRVASAWVQQSGRLYEADLTNTRTGRDCRVTVEAGRFVAPADRRVEITRQLEARGKR
jgi:hypothetical protein